MQYLKARRSSCASRYTGFQVLPASDLSRSSHKNVWASQLALMNLESLVPVCQHRAGNPSLFLAHTARRFTGVASVRVLLGGWHEYWGCN